MPPETGGDPRGRRLAADLLRAGVAVRVQVRGASMGPTLADGDQVEIEPLAAPPRRGEIVYAELPAGGYVLHRVLRTPRDGCVQTRGDACWRLDDPLAPAQVLGRARRHRRGDAAWRCLGRPGVIRVLAELATSWLAYRRRDTAIRVDEGRVPR